MLGAADRRHGDDSRRGRECETRRSEVVRRIAAASADASSLLLLAAAALWACADIDERTTRGLTPIMDAASAGIGLFWLCLLVGAVFRACVLTRSPCFVGRHLMVQFLAEQGADLSLQTVDGAFA